MAPVIECTVSKATILGMVGSTFHRKNPLWFFWNECLSAGFDEMLTLLSSSLRCTGSLCRKMWRGTPLFLIPWIMEAWLPASEKISQPGRALASVNRVESLATKQDEKTRPASFWCRSARSLSRYSCSSVLPEMLRVPPAPAPYLSNAVLWKSKNRKW